MVLGAVVSLFVISGILILLQPVFATLGNVNLVIFFVVFLTGAIFAGVSDRLRLRACDVCLPVTHHAHPTVDHRGADGRRHVLAHPSGGVPLFVLLGYLIEMTGMARGAMVGFLANLVGHIRGRG